MEKVRLIREALIYTQSFARQTFVIKIDSGLLSSFEGVTLARDISVMASTGVKLYVIHSEEKLPGYFLNSEYFQIKFEQIKPDGKIGLIYIRDEEKQLSDILAADLAIKLKADKLIYITPFNGIYNHKRELISLITINEINNLLENKLIKDELSRFSIGGSVRRQLIAAKTAVDNGVKRVHLVNGKKDGAMLEEIFSCEGTGTLIYTGEQEYGEIAQATIKDTTMIMELLVECDFPDFSKRMVLSQINNFLVFRIDNDIAACALLHESNEELSIQYFAISENYHGPNLTKQIFDKILSDAKIKGLKKIILLPNNWSWLFVNPYIKKIGFRKNDNPAGSLIIIL